MPEIATRRAIIPNSPHAYNQNKAFTQHIVDAMMQSFEESLNWMFLSQGNFIMSGTYY